MGIGYPYRNDKDLTEKCGVCELHFTDDCIDRFFYDTVPIKRDKIRLKDGSIPTIFPNI